MNNDVKIVKRSVEEKSSLNEKYNWVKLKSDLPSRGVSYPKDYIIQYKKYTFEEVQYFNSELTHGSEVDKILYSLDGIECSFDKMELAYYDLIYINILKKLKCWSNNYFLSSFNCPECGEDNLDVQTRLDDIEIKDLPDEIVSLPFYIDIQETNLEFGLLTVGNVIDLLEKGLIDNPIANFAKLIKNKSLNEAISFINNISDGDDIDTINEIDSVLNMNRGVIDISCKHCTKLVEVKVRDLAVIAEPFREPKKSIRDRILFSKT